MSFFRRRRKSLGELYQQLQRVYPEVRILDTQSISSTGTLRIRESGRYKLNADLVCNFQPTNDHFPTGAQLASSHPAPPYVLGFFAGITLEADWIELDLNGHEIRMHPDFYLQQRFFSCIELSGSPFITGQGPANFGDLSRPIKGVWIHNGRLGLSSHHGIHGNGARLVHIWDLEIRDFEVAPISLNGCSRVKVNNLNVPCSASAVPVRATYSNARFLARHLESKLSTLGDRTITLRGEELRGEEISSRLRQAMDRAFQQIRREGKPNTDVEPFAPANGSPGLPDGNLYGFLWNRKGVAVGPFLAGPGDLPEDDETAKYLHIHDVTIGKLASAGLEVRGLARPAGAPKGGYTSQPVQTGPFGDVFRIDDAVDPENGLYRRDVLADAQLFLAKHTSSTSIQPEIVEWAAQNTLPLSHYLGGSPKLVGSIDIMAHSMKGNIGIFLQGLEHGTVERVNFSCLENHGPLATPTEYSATKAPPYQGCINRVVAVVACKEVHLESVHCNKVASEFGSCYGCSTINGEEPHIENLVIEEVQHGNQVVPHIPPNPAPEVRTTVVEKF